MLPKLMFSLNFAAARIASDRDLHASRSTFAILACALGFYDPPAGALENPLTRNHISFNHPSFGMTQIKYRLNYARFRQNLIVP